MRALQLLYANPSKPGSNDLDYPSEKDPDPALSTCTLPFPPPRSHFSLSSPVLLSHLPHVLSLRSDHPHDEVLPGQFSMAGGTTLSFKLPKLFVSVVRMD